MQARERFLRFVAGEAVDRCLLWPEDQWPETTARWIKEGLNSQCNFGYDFCPSEIRLPIQLGYLPAWEREVLEDEGKHYLVRDLYGVVRRVPHGGREDIAQYVSFPVQSRQDWKVVKRRLAAHVEGRFPNDWNNQIQALRARQGPVIFGGGHLCGFYSFVRELCGDEEAAYLFYDDPALVEEMMEFQSSRLIALLETAAASTPIDILFIWEDMCYRNGPLIGPDLFRQFLFTPYKRLIEKAKSLGVRAIDVDSDGDVTLLLPLWIEAGVNMMHPFEVQSGMDVNVVKREYGDSLVVRGGIDKRELAKDRTAIDREIERVRPAFEAGKYIPAADHSIPPDVSLDNFRYYLEKRTELVGSCKAD